MGALGSTLCDDFIWYDSPFDHHVWSRRICKLVSTTELFCHRCCVVRIDLDLIFYDSTNPTLTGEDFNDFSKKWNVLQSKAKLFDPDNVDNVETLLFWSSHKKCTVVNSLNQAKQSLLSRLKSSRINNSSIYWLNILFCARYS